MTEPQQPSIRDTMAMIPAELVTGIVDTPDGQRLAVTLRTIGGEARVLVAKDDALHWARTLETEANKMSSSGLVIAHGGVVAPAPGTNGGKQ
jgi:hypothetical protein